MANASALSEKKPPLVSVISKQTNSSIHIVNVAKISNLPDFWATYPIFEEVFHHVDSLLVKIFNGLSRPGIVKVESFQFKTDSVTF